LGGLTPQQLAAAYGVAPLWNAGFKGQGRRIALIELGVTFSQPQYSALSNCFGPWPSITTDVVGTPAPTDTTEGTIDAINVASMAPAAQIYMFESPPGTQVEQLLPQLLSAALNPANTGGARVDTISISFGGCEPIWKPAELSAAQTALQAASSMGVAVFVAQGDQGSAGYYLHNGFPNCVGVPANTQPYSKGGWSGAPGLLPFIPYPASSPLVTAVGGTELAINGVVPIGTWPPGGSPSGGTITDEVVWNQHAPPSYSSTPGWPDLFFAGGGGLSTLFTTSNAPWQVGIGLTGAEHKPDIAAMAGWPYYIGPKFGTSGASPLMAGAVAVLDGYLAANQLNTTGPVNPLLYRIAEDRKLYHRVFNDVIHGSNDLLNEGCCTAGPFYDLASGLGSLNFTALANTLVIQDQFQVSHIKTERDGTVKFRLHLPGAGRANVLETAWNDNFAHAATLLRPALNRFVFARKRLRIKRDGTFTVTVKPNSGGHRLVARHAYPVTLRLWVSWIPDIGGTQRNLGFYGIHLGCDRHCASATKTHTGS
jgi:kumamolisin